MSPVSQIAVPVDTHSLQRQGNPKMDHFPIALLEMQSLGLWLAGLNTVPEPAVPHLRSGYPRVETARNVQRPQQQLADQSLDAVSDKKHMSCQ